jgi:hypothetical protein
VTASFVMRKEGLGFLDRAPLVHVAEAEVAASRRAVFSGLREAEGWKHWFPRVRAMSYTSPPPHGVGTIREIDISRMRWVEEIIAWDDDTRLAWTILRGPVPWWAAAQVESFELVDAGQNTRVQWTFALEPRLLARLSSPFAARALSRWLQGAMDGLGAYLTGTTHVGRRAGRTLERTGPFPSERGRDH